MQKTKKIISVIAAMFMLFSMMAPMASAAEFSDVASTHKYYTAISNLSAYGILDGFGDGTFRPEDNVTRAQFAKIICYACYGSTSITGAVDTGFTDVDPNHWAAGNIKMAAANGIVNGMGDGTFAPEDNVKFEQAVKMIVCALGYNQRALDNGGYPQGFVSVAADLGLLKGLAADDNVQGSDANRGTIAKLVDNMLEADTLTSTGETGGSLKDQTVKTESESGQVVSVYGSTIYADEKSECSRNQIEVLVGKERRFYSVSELDSVKANVNDYLGKRVTVYYSADDELKIPVLTNLTLQAKKNIVTVVDLADIEEYSNTEIQYIADREEGDVEELTVLSDANILYNGVATDDELENLIDLDAPGQVTFIDSDADGDVDVVFVKVYTTIIVKSKTTSSYKLYGENNESVVLDEESASITIKKNNKTSEFKNISTGDVVSYASSAGDKVIDVLVSNTVVSGAISSINATQGTITIKTSSGTSTYKKSSYFDTYSTATLEVGVSGKFYIDAFGKIVKADVSSESAYTYGYLTGLENVGASTAPSYSIQVIKLNGSSSAAKTTYSLANKFKIDGESFSHDDDQSDIENALNAAADIFNPGYGSFTSDETYNQVIKFTTNSSGKIDKIITAAYDLDEDNMLKVEKMSVKCTTTGKTLDKMYNIGSAKVLVLSEDDNGDDEFAGYSASYFKSGSTTYDVQLIDMGDDYKVPYVLVYGGSGSGTVMWEDYAPMVVTGKGIGTPEGTSDPANYINVLTYTGAEEQYYEGEDSTGALDDVAVGDVLRIAFDGEGFISEIKVVTTLEKMLAAGKTGGQAAGANGEGTNKSQTNAEYREIFGTANKVNDGSIIVALAFVDENGDLDLTDGENITVGTSTKVIVIDSAKVESGNKTPITVEVVEEIIGYDAQPDNASKILIYTSNSTTAKTIFVFK